MERSTQRHEVVVADEAWDWGELPYSQAIVSDGLVFVSGQLGVDLRTGQPMEGVVEQTRSVLRQIQSILAAAGCDMSDVVKTHCYLTNRQRDYVEFNQVYREFFGDNKPARVTVEVSNLAPGFIVEIDAIASKRQR